MLLARLSDGKSFVAYPFDSDFDTKAQNSFAFDEISKSKIKFENVAPGKLIVPPVFLDEIAVIYIKDD